MAFLFCENLSHCDPYLHYAIREAESTSLLISRKLTWYKEHWPKRERIYRANVLHFKQGNWSMPYDTKKLVEQEKLLPKYKPTVTALPFKDDKPSVPSGSTELSEHTEGGSPDSEDNESEDAGAFLRITTRANVPYDGFRNRKKAMLLLHVSSLKYSREYDETVPGKMAEITDTFSRFGFQIEQHRDLTDDITLRDTCRKFFRRNFTKYCCVAVVLLNGDLKDRCHLNNRDFDIVRHWIIEENRTMQGKPKIYINETNWNFGTVFRRGRLRRYCVPITELYHPDVLCFHVPSISYYRRVTQPLTIFCNKLATMADEDLMTVIKETVLASEPQFRAWTFVATTQHRRLYLNS